MNRRDQKKGQQKAVMTTTPDGDLEVVVTWDEPNPGEQLLFIGTCVCACHK